MIRDSMIKKKIITTNLVKRGHKTWNVISHKIEYVRTGAEKIAENFGENVSNSYFINIAENMKPVPLHVLQQRNYKFVYNRKNEGCVWFQRAATPQVSSIIDQAKVKMCRG